MQHHLVAMDLNFGLMLSCCLMILSLQTCFAAPFNDSPDQLDNDERIVLQREKRDNTMDDFASNVALVRQKRMDAIDDSEMELIRQKRDDLKDPLHNGIQT